MFSDCLTKGMHVLFKKLLRKNFKHMSTLTTKQIPNFMPSKFNKCWFLPSFALVMLTICNLYVIYDIFAELFWEQIDDHLVTVLSWLKHTYWTLVSLLNYPPTSSSFYNVTSSIGQSSYHNVPVVDDFKWVQMLISLEVQAVWLLIGLARSLFIRRSQHKLSLYHEEHPQFTPPAARLVSSSLQTGTKTPGATRDGQCSLHQRSKSSQVAKNYTHFVK